MKRIAPVWVHHLLIASSYERYTDMFAINKPQILLGQEWEFTPRWSPNLIDTSSYIGRYTFALVARRWVDGSGPLEFAVPVVSVVDDGRYNAEALIRQAAFFALLSLPHDECQICGRHIHLSRFVDGDFDVRGIRGMRVYPLHEFMWTMYHMWTYRDGRWGGVHRQSLDSYARRNEHVDDSHYSAININPYQWGWKPYTVEVRHAEVLPIVALPAVIYAVEYLFKRNADAVIKTDPHSDEYFDHVLKLCNDPLCAEIITSLRDYAMSKGSVRWNWFAVREALGHLIEPAMYELLTAIELDSENVLEVARVRNSYIDDAIIQGYVHRIYSPDDTVTEITMREAVECRMRRSCA
jgi:hypothetical protein